MAVKVYGMAKSSCTQRVLACLLEKGLDFEIVHVDIDAGDHKRPEFLLRQPFGKVPAIEDGEFTLYESRAIIRYYAAKHDNQGPKLLGTTLEERAQVDQWLEVESNYFNDSLFTMVFQLVFLPRMGKAGDMELARTCEQKLEKVLDVYDRRLSESRYLAGDEFTLADLTHLSGIRYLMDDANMGHLVNDRKHVKAWWENISNRPAWKKLMKIAFG